MAVRVFGNGIIPFLAYFLVEVTGEQQYGGLGGEITLTPKVYGQPEDILWKHNGNKVVEFDGSQNVEYGRYKDRTILVWDSGALTIKGLTDADSGPYELEAVVKGKLQYSQHEVGVIDDVAQPSVTCVVNNTTPENMDRTLLCSADLQPLTQFIWRSPGGSESPGTELFIPGGENQESVYTCVVKNPVSERTAEFTLNDCYTEKGSSTVLVVCLSLFVILLLIVLVGGILNWKAKKDDRHLPGSTERKSDVKRQPEEGNVKRIREFFENKARQSSERNENYNPPCRQTDSHPNTETVSETESVQDQDEQATTPLLNKSGAMLPHSVDTHAALVQKGKKLDSYEHQDPQREDKVKCGSDLEIGVGEQEKNLSTMANTLFHGAKDFDDEERFYRAQDNNAQATNERKVLTLQTTATPDRVWIPTPLLPEPSQAQLDPELSGLKQENKPDLDQTGQDTATSTLESNQGNRQDPSPEESNQGNKKHPSTEESKLGSEQDHSAEESNQGNKQGPSTVESNQGEKQGPSAEESNQGNKQGPSTEESKQEREQAPSTVESNQGNKQGPSVEESNQGKKKDSSTEESNQGSQQDHLSEESNQGSQQGSSADESNQGYKQGFLAEESNQEENLGPSAEESNQGYEQGPLAEESNQGEKQGPSAVESNQGNKQGPSTEESKQEREQAPSTVESNQGNKQGPSAEESNQGKKKDSSTEDSNQGSQQDHLSEESNQGSQQGSSAVESNQGYEQGPLAEESNQGEKQGPLAEESNQGEKQGPSAVESNQ
uniref:Ig-like domain-containing protein n=1 Tax=Hucho hucho TaxID=62062 RepID=A0A4W5RNZ5_9TELE